MVLALPTGVAWSEAFDQAQLVEPGHPMLGGVAIREEHAMHLVGGEHPMPTDETKDVPVPVGERGRHVATPPRDPPRPPPARRRPHRTHAHPPIQSGLTTGGGKSHFTCDDATPDPVLCEWRHIGPLNDPPNDPPTDPPMSHPQARARLRATGLERVAAGGVHIGGHRQQCPRQRPQHPRVGDGTVVTSPGAHFAIRRDIAAHRRELRHQMALAPTKEHNQTPACAAPGCHRLADGGGRRHRRSAAGDEHPRRTHRHGDADAGRHLADAGGDPPRHSANRLLLASGGECA